MWRARNIVVGDENRITVRRTLDSGVDANRTARAGTVFNDHLLTELAGHVLADHASDEVQPAPCRERHNETDRAARPILGPRRHWPTCHRTAKQRNELAPLHRSLPIGSEGPLGFSGLGRGIVPPPKLAFW